MSLLLRVTVRSALALTMSVTTAVGFVPSVQAGPTAPAPVTTSETPPAAGTPSMEVPEKIEPTDSPRTAEPHPVPAPNPEPSAAPPPQPAPTADWNESPQFTPTPAPADAPPAPRPSRRRSTPGLGMLISGFSIFGATWLLSAFIGAAAVDTADDDADYDADRRRDFGTRLMIPVGGPFAAAFVAPRATGALVATLDGVAHVAGLTLGIVGSVMLGRARARQDRMTVGFTPAPGGGFARFGMQF